MLAGFLYCGRFKLSDDLEYYVYKDTQEKGDAKYTFAMKYGEVPKNAAEITDCRKGEIDYERI